MKFDPKRPSRGQKRVNFMSMWLGASVRRSWVAEVRTGPNLLKSN